MALASGLVTAADDQEQAAASLSNATPALLPPTIDCYRKQPDGRLHHRNRPFVSVGATDWVCPSPDLASAGWRPAVPRGYLCALDALARVISISTDGLSSTPSK